MHLIQEVTTNVMFQWEGKETKKSLAKEEGRKRERMGLCTFGCGQRSKSSFVQNQHAAVHELCDLSLKIQMEIAHFKKSTLLHHESSQHHEQ